MEHKKLFIVIPILFICLLTSLVYSAENKSYLSGFGFIENKGQEYDLSGNKRHDILFTYSINGAKIYFFKDKISYILIENLDEENVKYISPSSIDTIGWRTDLIFQNSNKDVIVSGSSPLSGYVNYYLNGDANGVLQVQNFQYVEYKNIYPQVDILFYGNKQSGLKYDFIVHPGGNVKDIKLTYKGIDFSKITKTGNLEISFWKYKLIENIPLAYTTNKTSNETQAVNVNYLLLDNSISFSTPNYKTSNDDILVIDPWATYYGGSAKGEYALSVTVDDSGNTIVSGFATSIGFPTTTGAIRKNTTDTTTPDGFILKVDNCGQRLWATYFGGYAYDKIRDVITDNANYIYVTGITASNDFPIKNAFDSMYAGQSKAFVSKVDPAGKLLWSTYLGGGTTATEAIGIVVDGNNNIFVTGYTDDPNFPATSGAFQESQTVFLAQDAFIAKYDSSGIFLSATYYGGANSSSSTEPEQGYGLAVDNSNNIYLTGISASPTLPQSSGGIQATNAGGVDAFLAKFNNNLSSVFWSTFYGGSDNEQDGDGSFGRGAHGDIAIDNSGNLIVVGSTKSTDFPVLNGFQESYSGGDQDAFIAKFDVDGVPIWSTFYGGDYEDWGRGIIVDKTSNDILITGATASNNFPITTDAIQDSLGGNMDAFIAILDKNGNQKHATFYGGADEGTKYDAAFGCAYDKRSNVVFVGATHAQDFPVTAGAWQPSKPTDGYDIDAAFIVLLPFGSASSSNIDISPDTTICSYDSVQLSATLISGAAESYLWSPVTGLNDASLQKPIAKPEQTTTYEVAIKQECETTSSSVTISVDTCIGDCGNAHLPSAFSPNNDGNNDVLYPLLGDGVNVVELIVYDRWGNILFESQDNFTGWDGNYKNASSEMGMYLYRLTTDCGIEELDVKKGKVFLLK